LFQVRQSEKEHARDNKTHNQQEQECWKTYLTEESVHVVTASGTAIVVVVDRGHFDSGRGSRLLLLMTVLLLLLVLVLLSELVLLVAVLLLLTILVAVLLLLVSVLLVAILLLVAVLIATVLLLLAVTKPKARTSS
jgi:hypothetical protein